MIHVGPFYFDLTASILSGPANYRRKTKEEEEKVIPANLSRPIFSDAQKWSTCTCPQFAGIFSVKLGCASPCLGALRNRQKANEAISKDK